MNTYAQDIFPYDVLETFGLTRSMIDDLPEYILETIYNGGRSPLLPIVVPNKNGMIKAQAKFRLISSSDDENKADVIFYPKLSEAKLEMFTEEEKEQLLDGKVILANITIPSHGSEDTTHEEECFVQIDPDTNHVFYAHTPVIGRNLRSIDSFIDLSPEDMDNLLKGNIIEVDEPELMTIGIDLFTSTGVFVCQGDEMNWRCVKDKAMPPYSFGVDGCWVNKDGELRYVKEEDFDAEITEAYNTTINNAKAMEAYESQERYYPKNMIYNLEGKQAEEKAQRR